MKKWMGWPLDIAMGAIVIIGFEIIDLSLAKLQQVPFYYDYLTTAKWLLVGGFAVHGLINWLSTRRG